MTYLNDEHLKPPMVLNISIKGERKQREEKEKRKRKDEIKWTFRSIQF